MLKRKLLFVAFMLLLNATHSMALPPSISEQPEALYSKSGNWLTQQNFNSGVNVVTPFSYMQDGHSVMRVGTQSPASSLFIGQYAGAAANTQTNIFATGVGTGALQNLTSSQEDTCMGVATCNSLTTANSSSAFGQHALGYETTNGGNAAVGNDSMRNTNGSSNNATLGFNAYRNAGSGSYVVAIGSQTAYGNASSITLAGTPTTGEVITVTFSSTYITGKFKANEQIYQNFFNCLYF